MLDLTYEDRFIYGAATVCMTLITLLAIINV
jgi:hypothetical protein